MFVEEDFLERAKKTRIEKSEKLCLSDFPWMVFTKVVSVSDPAFYRVSSLKSTAGVVYTPLLIPLRQTSVPSLALSA